jgi:hypothetical protein
MKKILATLVTAAVIGAGGMAVASAADSPKASTPSSTATAKPDAAALKSTIGTKIRRFAFSTAATTIGVSPADLLKDMKGGHSIADVATAHKVDPQKVIDAIVTGADAKIQQAVTNGRISSAEGAKLEQFVATAAPKFVNATPRQLAHRKTVAGAIDVSAKTIGVTPQALRQAIVSGQSVAQVAGAHRVSPTTVVNALVTAGNARIEKALANHHLSAAQAAKLKARLPQAAQRFVDFTRKPAQKQAAAA